MSRRGGKEVEEQLQEPTVQVKNSSTRKQGTDARYIGLMTLEGAQYIGPMTLEGPRGSHWASSSAFLAPPPQRPTHQKVDTACFRSPFTGNRPNRVVFAHRVQSTVKYRSYRRSQISASSSYPDLPAPPTSIADEESSVKLRVNTPIWRLLAETAIQLTVAGFAVAASVIAKAKFFAFASAFLSVPQVVFSVQRFLGERQRQAGPEELSDTSGELQVPSKSAMPSAVIQREPEESSTALLTTAAIRTAIAEEVDGLRCAVEQAERATLEREQFRNTSIAEAIASLDGGIRSLRRTVETRNQVERAAPFAIVSELELVRSRLKHAEQEKTELQMKLQTAEVNFEEAKRQGERARSEADEALRKELLLQTELATVSSRLARLDEITDRLERAERLNDELKEKLIAGSREQEDLRQSAADAERRVLRVENISRMLRERLQSITGVASEASKKPRPRSDSDQKEQDTEEKFWEKRLRRRGSFNRDSLLYQELMGKEREGYVGQEWPEGALQGGRKSNKGKTQVDKLPPDGGFGTFRALAAGQDFKQLSGSEDENARLPDTASEKAFSFSRGEFDDAPKGVPGQLAAQAPENREEHPPTLMSEDRPDLPDYESISVENEEVSPAVNGGEEPHEAVNRPPKYTTGEGSVPEGQLQETSDGRISASLPSNVNNDVHETTLTRAANSLPSTQETPTPGQTFGSGSSDETARNDLGEVDGTGAAAEQGPSSKTPSKRRRHASPFDGQGEKVQSSNDSLADAVTETSATLSSEAHRRSPDRSAKGTMETDSAGKLDQSVPGPAEAHSDISNGDIPEVGSHNLAADELQASQGSSQSNSFQAHIEESMPPRSRLESEQQESERPQVREQGTEPSYQCASEEELKDSSSEGQSGLPRAQTEGEGTASETGPVRSSEDQVEAPSVLELVHSATDLVKKARRRGLAVAQADVLFSKAVTKLGDAVILGASGAEFDSQFGSAYLAWAKVNLADVGASLRLVRALGHLSRSLELRPDDETTVFNTGLCLCLLASTSQDGRAKQYYVRACEFYEKLLQLNGMSRIGSFNCGLAYISLARLTEAEGDSSSEICREYFRVAADRFRRSLELKPGDAKATAYLKDCERHLAELQG